jgi:hypothetical protein
MSEELYQPVPPGTKRNFSPQQALNEVINLVDPEYEVYFRTGTVILQKGSSVSAEERQLIRSLRNEILSGGNVERVYDNINRFLTSGSTFRNNRAQIAAVLRGTNYVRPSEDPADRDPSTPGFGRALGEVQPEQDGAPPVVGVDERRAGVDEAELGGLPDRPTPEQAYEGIAQPGMQTTPSSGDGVVDDSDGVDTGGGVSDGAYVDQTELDAAIPEDWKDAAREAYPAYYAIVKNIPEIAQLLEKAINQGYSEAQFQAELEQTNWWKQTTASAREWDINGERDPASQQTQIDNRTAFIQQTSLDTFGVRISAESASELALDSLRQGWGQQFLLNSIGDVATQSTAGISQLRAGFIGQDIRQTAYDYGIAISENTFNKFVNQIAVGAETKDTFQQYALTQAKNLFPSVAERLNAGETFQQIVDPYKQNAAALLEIDPNSIDFTSPDWAKAITYQDAKGEQRPMNFTEFNDYVRQTRSFGYEYTDQAKNKAYKVASDLANLFGRI